MEQQSHEMRCRDKQIGLGRVEISHRWMILNILPSKNRNYILCRMHDLFGTPIAVIKHTEAVQPKFVLLLQIIMNYCVTHPISLTKMNLPCPWTAHTARGWEPSEEYDS